MTAKPTTCPKCGYEFPSEVDIGGGQKSRMGSFAETCPICNAEINPPSEQDQARPGFRPETKAPRKKPEGQHSPGRKRKKKKRR